MMMDVQGSETQHRKTRQLGQGSSAMETLKQAFAKLFDGQLRVGLPIGQVSAADPGSSQTQPYAISS